MRALLGIDLGTSSVKVVVSSMEGAVEGLGAVEYTILTPTPPTPVAKNAETYETLYARFCDVYPRLKTWF